MLMINAIIITVIFLFETNMAETAGMIRKEKTVITPFIFTANTMAKPIEI